MTAASAPPLAAEAPSDAPPVAERDALFRTFGRAWFKRDVDLLYQATTADFEWRGGDGGAPIRDRAGVAAAFAAMASRTTPVRFADVVYHHAPDASFMTFRIIETDPATGVETTEIGVERYLFRDGRIAVKDVFKKRG